jgi:hypothetical protein
MGNRDAITRLRRGYGHGDETTDDSEQDSDGEGEHVRLPLTDPEEEALADAAVARIQRAQARGKKDVKLSKEELAAYQRRLQRMEDEERRQRRQSRVAIPISQLDPSSRMRQSLNSDNRPRSITPDRGEERRPGYPPMGYFPPPSSSGGRPRSGTASSRTPSRAAIDREREQSSSPFTYTYVRGDPAASTRHPSDSSTGRPLEDSATSSRNRASPAPMQDSSRHSQLVDPFQYMTGGARTSYHAGGGSVRNSVLEVVDAYDDYGDGSRRRINVEPRGGDLPNEESVSRGRRRDSVDARPEPVPERRGTRDRTPPPPSKKSSSTQSPPVRRKSVAVPAKSDRKKRK